ncbi:MAG: hypothetical protein Q9205_006161 [Flavoplaca limonia]
MSPCNIFKPAYVDDATAESDYDYHAQSGSEDGLIQKSVEEVIPAGKDKPSNDLRDEDYSTYNKLLQEARDFYREEKPPFTSITTSKIQASRSAVLATANGERPTTITPDLLLALTRREWSPQYWFWTADYKGERFIVKAVNGRNSLGGNSYRRWCGIERSFSKNTFLVPYRKDTTVSKAPSLSQERSKVTTAKPGRPTAENISSTPLSQSRPGPAVKGNRLNTRKSRLSTQDGSTRRPARRSMRPHTVNFISKQGLAQFSGTMPSVPVERVRAAPASSRSLQAELDELDEIASAAS